jgi:hypothetical protein
MGGKISVGNLLEKENWRRGGGHKIFANFRKYKNWSRIRN